MGMGYGCCYYTWLVKVRCFDMRDVPEFDQETALAAAQALEQVLQQRTHQRKYLGQLYTVPGSLGKALNLPKITTMLKSKVMARRDAGVEQFEELWYTLSEDTKDKVLQELGWYDPKELGWDDKRSNRRPTDLSSAPTDKKN